MNLHIRIRRPSAKNLRDLVTFLLGAIGLVYEALTGGVEKPTLIIAFVGLMGLPLFIRGDEAHQTPPPPTIEPPPPARAPDPPEAPRL